MKNKFNIILLPGDGIGQEISSQAKKILNSWPKEMKRFIKVMPTDYKRALEILAKETTKN